MGWHTPRKWTLGELGSAAELNEISDNLKALITKCRVYNTAGFVLAASTFANVYFDSVVNDPFGMWSAGAPTHITAPIDGSYRVHIIGYGISSAGANPQLYKNGVFLYTGGAYSIGSGVFSFELGPWEVPMVAGDYLECNLQAGGATFTLSNGLGPVIPASGGPALAMSVDWVGP